jgi:excisionase family DNA binding protein
MRRNPASERRHGPRFAVSTNASPNYIGEEDPEASSIATAAEAEVAARFSPKHAASRQAATSEERKETCASVSSGGKPGQLSAGAASHSSVTFEPLLDTTDAANLLRIHPKTLRVKAASGIIPGIQIGRVWRFRVSILNRWLEEIADYGPK